MTVVDKSISAAYLLVINIPLHRDAAGRWWGDPLWVKDLLLHLEGIEHIRLLCPLTTAMEAQWIPIDTQRILIVPVMPPGRQWWWHVLSLYRQIDREVQNAEIVHGGVAGWPFPLGWLAGWSSLLRKRFLMIVIESSFWRVPQGQRVSLGRRLHAMIHERLAGFFARRADLLVVTQPGYRALAGAEAQHCLLNPASWVDEEFILSREAAEAIWQAKPRRLLYAGRLTRDKGISVLLEALRPLGNAAPAVDIVGDGELRGACLALAAEMPDVVRVLDPVAYGQPFFELLDGYQAIIVPILSDEQPRIIFDAHARAIPVFGSDAVGVASCVASGQTGWLHLSGDSLSLSRSLTQEGASPDRLREMGLIALDRASRNTHRSMHRQRIERLVEAYGRWLRKTGSVQAK